MILYPNHLHKTYKGFATLECFIYKNIQLVKMHFIMKILAHTDESPTQLIILIFCNGMKDIISTIRPTDC